MKNYTTSILVLFGLLVIAILGNIIISALGLFFNYDIIYTNMLPNNEISLNVKLIFAFKAIALIVFIYGVYVLITKLKYLVRRDFFNEILVRGFYKSGQLFLLAGLVGILTSVASILNLSLIRDYSSQFYLNIDSKSLYIMLMILGFILILFSKVLNKGNALQQENDLTI